MLMKKDLRIIDRVLCCYHFLLYVLLVFYMNVFAAFVDADFHNGECSEV
jgi:hypothetical protein